MATGKAKGSTLGRAHDGKGMAKGAQGQDSAWQGGGNGRARWIREREGRIKGRR